MFGKDAENEDESGDEEWGPHVRKKSRKEANEDGCLVVNSTSEAKKVLDDDVPVHMSKYSRIPPSAVKVHNLLCECVWGLLGYLFIWVLIDKN